MQRRVKVALLVIILGDVNLCFADDRGVVVAEMFQELVRGAAFSTQILNVALG